MQQSREERSLGELFAELSQETSTLVRQEVALAKAEMSQQASRVGKDIGFLAVGGAILYAGFLVILAAVTIILAEFMPWWLSTLLVGIVVAGVGFGLVQKGRKDLKQTNLVPQQTIETLKEDKEWAKQQTG
jgi:tetrahydromethanopterin S-methyltransferase subunit G